MQKAEGQTQDVQSAMTPMVSSGAQIALKVQYSAGIAVSEVMDPFLFIDFNSGMENASSSLHYLSKALSCILVMEEVPALCHLIKSGRMC